MAAQRQASALGPAWLLQAAHIARRFHLDGLSKVEIADETGLSRFKVARILDEARELGVVRVSVELPAAIDAGLSARLALCLDIERAVVVRHQDPSTPVRTAIGRVGADLLTELVTAEDTLGLSCSRSVLSATGQLDRLAPCRVVQLTGTLAGQGGEGGSVESVRHAAAVGGGQGYPIYAPMLVDNGATASSLLHQPAIADTVAEFESVTVALVALGGWGDGVSTIWDEVSPADRADARRRGTVGEIGGRLFDSDGRAVETGIDSRVLGVSLERIRAISQVIVLAHHGDRAESVVAAARGGLVGSLVCDDALATTVLELAGAR